MMTIGVAHGGSTAAMLDQFFGILFATLAPRGFTANLNINYRKPVLANHTCIPPPLLPHL